MLWQNVSNATSAKGGFFQTNKKKCRPKEDGPKIIASLKENKNTCFSVFLLLKIIYFFTKVGEQFKKSFGQIRAQMSRPGPRPGPERASPPLLDLNL